MSTSAKLFMLGMVFFGPLAAIYWYFTSSVQGQWEPVGVIGILLLGVMTLMVGLYLRATISKLDTDPGDNHEAAIADSAGDYGFFPPHSWWPLGLGLGAFTVFLGVAISNHSGWWLFVVGVVLGVWALIGWTFEFYRGEG